MAENRKSPRVNMTFEVVLTANGGPEISGILRDVAIQGLFVHCDSTIALGASIWFRIVLPGELENLEVVGKGEVVRIEPKGLGLHFTAIDPECVQLLRNLIACNADDPESAWAEMLGDCGQRQVEGNE